MFHITEMFNVLGQKEMRIYELERDNALLLTEIKKYDPKFGEVKQPPDDKKEPEK